MADFFTISNLANLGVLLFLQAVLGFDNLLYISIESQRAPESSQKSVRRNAILIAIGLRIVMLFVIINLLESFTEPWFHLDYVGIVEGSFNFSVLVFLFGGGFIMYTAVKEISHMLVIQDLKVEIQERSSTSAARVTAILVMMNLIFSFDSILSALAITDVFSVLAIAIVGSGLAMLVLADRVSAFLARNRKYEVLGLFILLIVGIMLLGEGGHVAELTLFGHRVDPLSKTTFYFSITVLVLVDLIQSRYQRKLAVQRQRELTDNASASAKT
ncbi:MAG TPA: tellurium resistance protein TerC [Nannocystis exedens]|nr:tellurium resistance protein TerC [Nannocystis exedens]